MWSGEKTKGLEGKEKVETKNYNVFNVYERKRFTSKVVNLINIKGKLISIFNQKLFILEILSVF